MFRSRLSSLASSPKPERASDLVPSRGPAFLHITSFTELPAEGRVLSRVLTTLLFAAALTATHVIFTVGTTAPDFDVPRSFFFLSTAILGCHIILALRSFRGNMVITVRYLLLFVPVFSTSLLWFTHQGEIRTHYLGYSYQTTRATMILVTGGGLSVLGATLGWYLGSLRLYEVGRLAKPIRRQIAQQSSSLIRVGSIGCLLFGLLYLRSAGGLIGGSSVYGAASRSSSQGSFAAYNVVQMFAAALALIGVQYAPRYSTRRRVLRLLVLGFSLGILAGSRADYLPPIAMLLVYGYATREAETDSSTDRRRKNSILVLFLVIAPAFYLFATSIAAWRASPETGFVSHLLRSVSEIDQVVFEQRGDHRVFWMETGNHAVGGFYSMIAQRQLGHSSFLYGSSYMDMVPRLLPSVVRPASLIENDLAWHTSINGDTLTQGGIFEPAEAYANFGLVGCFVVSTMISFLLATILRLAIRRASFVHMAWYLTSGFILLRGTWYQTFALVRVASVAAFFYLVIWLWKPDWVSSGARQQINPRRPPQR